MDDSVSRFWDKFTEKSRSYGISPENTQAYIMHANQFILQADGKRLVAHNAADIDTWLTDKGRNPELNDACFCEIALSLKILFVEVVGSEWALNFNWQKWLDTRDLPVSHATIARDNNLPGQDSGASTAALEIQTQFPDLFKRLITEIRVRQYSIRTEQAYEKWLVRFLRFVKVASAEQLTLTHISQFLSFLVVEREVAASTQNQALNAIVFFYRYVLERTIDDSIVFVRSKKPKKLPVVLSRKEVSQLIKAIKNPLHVIILKKSVDRVIVL